MATTKLWVLKILVPYFNEKRTRLGLAEDSWGLLIWDVWWSHIDTEVLNLCEVNHIKVNIVTAGYVFRYYSFLLFFYYYLLPIISSSFF